MKINLNKHDSIQAELDRVQKLAMVRTINLTELLAAVERIEVKLSHILHKKDWKGARVTVDLNAQSFPNAYKGIPESTVFQIEKFASGWYLIAMRRERTRSRNFYLNLMQEQKDAIAAFVIDKF